MDTVALGRELVRGLRGKRSQTAFSRRLGYRSNVVYTWESGRRSPTAAEALRAAGRAGIDVRDAVRRFYRTPPPWLDVADPATPEGVAAFLADLRGRTPLARLSEATGISRFAIARFLSGKAEPPLPAFLALIEATSLRLLDLIATLVDPRELPSARDAWLRLEAQRKVAYELPWTQAILRAVELAAYQELATHDDGWIARRLRVPIEVVGPCLTALSDAAEIRWDGRKWTIQDGMAVDTRRDAAAGRRLKAWWAGIGLERIQQGDDGLFSYNVFTVSEADLEKLRELHLGYFRALRAVIAESQPAERVVVANVQLFGLDLPAGHDPKRTDSGRSGG
jgi:transcriptional regulator with XRE-family HTH domain